MFSAYESLIEWRSVESEWCGELDPLRVKVQVRYQDGMIHAFLSAPELEPAHFPVLTIEPDVAPQVARFVTRWQAAMESHE